MGTVDDYLDELEPDDRAAIERVYAVARAEVPEAEQGKGYGMPALVYRGKPLISVMRAQQAHRDLPVQSGCGRLGRRQRAGGARFGPRQGHDPLPARASAAG